VVVLWGALRDYSGYGVRDMGLYVDPLTDTGRYLTAAAGRIPILLIGQWSPIPADLFIVLRPLSAFERWSAALFLGLLLYAMAPLLRRDHLARFWATGMLLAALPVSATMPSDRLLTFVGIGAAGLLAKFWEFVFASEDLPSNPHWRLPAKAVAWFLVAVHAVIAPIALPMRAANPLGPAWAENRLYVPMALGSSMGDRTVVIVNAPSPVHASYLVFRRELQGLTVPRYTRVLSPAMPSVSIRRLDERTLAIRPRGGYLRWPLDQVFRSERRGFALGEQVTLSGMTVTISSLTADGRPDEATFEFEVPLESPSLLWLCCRGGGFEAFTPPEVGHEAEIRFDWKGLLLPARPRRADSVCSSTGTDSD
jgi:hypothetical protein